jgi:hypothetical protein
MHHADNGVAHNDLVLIDAGCEYQYEGNTLHLQVIAGQIAAGVLKASSYDIAASMAATSSKSGAAF